MLFPFLVLAAAVGLSARPLPNPDLTRLKADLEFLASPAQTGRETATPGAARAAAHIAQAMQDAGLSPIKAGGLGGVTPFHQGWDYDGWLARRHPGRLGRALGPRLAAEASNVVGVIPGRDPALTGEYVFITAHFDHLGLQGGELHPGADDNASGTSGLLEVMRLLRYAQPRRSIAFLAVSGEEEGLLGSAAFLAQPPVPLKAIVADLNMDMIGRGRPGELHIMPARRSGYVTTLTRDARQAAARHGYTLSDGVEQFWRDSDEYSFLAQGIPSLTFMTGLHPDYHRPSDTPDKIDYRKLGATVAIVRDLALRTADAATGPEALPESQWSHWTWGPYPNGDASLDYLPARAN